MLFHPSSLNRPHPPVRGTPHHFPLCGYRPGLDIRGSSCLFLSPSDLSPLNFPELPPSLRRGVPMRAPQFFRIGSGHQVANRPLASPFTPQISFMWEGNFVASNNRSLSLRSGRTLARAPKATFPASPLKFRTSGFPGSGFKRQAPPQEFDAVPSATSATLKADPAMPVASSRVCAALRLDSTTRHPGDIIGRHRALCPGMTCRLRHLSQRPSLRTGYVVPPITA